MYNYLYDYKFKETLAYKNLDMLTNNEQLKIYDLQADYLKYGDDNIKKNDIKVQLDFFRDEWESENKKNNLIELKYYNIFNDINKIKIKIYNVIN